MVSFVTSVTLMSKEANYRKRIQLLTSESRFMRRSDCVHTAHALFIFRFIYVHRVSNLADFPGILCINVVFLSSFVITLVLCGWTDADVWRVRHRGVWGRVWEMKLVVYLFSVVVWCLSPWSGSVFHRAAAVRYDWLHWCVIMDYGSSWVCFSLL